MLSSLSYFWNGTHPLKSIPHMVYPISFDVLKTIWGGVLLKQGGDFIPQKKPSKKKKNHMMKWYKYDPQSSFSSRVDVTLTA